MRRQERRPYGWTDGQTDGPSLPEAHMDSGHMGAPETGLQGCLVLLTLVTGPGKALDLGPALGRKLDWTVVWDLVMAGDQRLEICFS